MSPSEFKPKPHYTIAETTIGDLDDVTRMREQSWIDNYVNDEHGVTPEWVHDRFVSQTAPETLDERARVFLDDKASRTFTAWVAVDDNNRVVGSATPVVTKEGEQRVGSIYVDKNWHGTGIGRELMQRVVDWHDPSKPIKIEVVAYNDRAIAFYTKWGFEKLAGSDLTFAEKLPVFTMIRPPENEMKETRI